MNTFKQNLKELRIEKKLTQKQLGNELNMTDDKIGTWERGIAEPSIEDIITLANYFNISTDELLGYETKIIKKAITYNHSIHNGDNKF